MRSMISVLVLPTLFLLLTCATADRNATDLHLGKETIESSIVLELTRTWGGLTVRLALVDDSNDSAFRKILHRLAVDNPESGFNYLMDNYYVAYLAVENAGAAEAALDTVSLRLVVDGEAMKPVPQKSLPKHIRRVNVKGTVKNVYNLGVMAAVTSFAVVSIVTCLDGRGCEGLRVLGDVIELSQKGETDPKRLFSSPAHKTRLKYDEPLESIITVPAGGKAAGVLFFGKKGSIAWSIAEIFYEKKKNIDLVKL